MKKFLVVLCFVSCMTCEKEALPTDATSPVTLYKRSFLIDRYDKIATIFGMHGNMEFCQELLRCLPEGFFCSYK